MSAFIVKASTINKIVTWLHDDQQFSNKVTLGSAGNYLRKFDYQLREKEKCQALVDEMLALNVSAVNQRYKEKQTTEPYRFSYEVASDIQTLKSLKCWLYQCSEGDVPGSNLFKIMNKIASMLCNTVVSRLPEYEQAAWE